MSVPDRAAKRLASKKERNLWLASVRPNGRPHLVPVWFVWADGMVYLCTAPDSVKVRNICANPRVTLALEDGSDPVVVEGEARLLDGAVSPEVAAAFSHKYDWDISTDTEYTVVVEVTPRRVVGGGAQATEEQ